MALLAVELRLPFFEEGGSALALILGGAAQSEEHRLQVQALGQGHFHAFVDRFQAPLYRERRIGEDLLGDGFGAGKELGGGIDLVDQADA